MIATPPRLAPAPTDDEVWAHRNRTWREWAMRLGVDWKALRVHMARRGWQRRTAGRCGGVVIERAPCAECQRPTPAAALSLRRVCAECRAASAEDPDVARFRAELARRAQARAA